MKTLFALLLCVPTFAGIHFPSHAHSNGDAD